MLSSTFSVNNEWLEALNVVDYSVGLSKFLVLFCTVFLKLIVKLFKIMHLEISICSCYLLLRWIVIIHHPEKWN